MDPVFSDSDAAVVRPLAFQISDGRGYTYVPDGTTFSVQPGTSAAHPIVELSADAWTAFAWELKTCFALLYADQLTVRQRQLRPDGAAGSRRFGWPSAIRRYSTSTIRSPSWMDRQRDGSVPKTFTLEDPPTEIRRASSQQVGLRASPCCPWTPREIEALRSDVNDALRHERDPMTGKSWWTTVDGREVCNRVNYLNEGSARIAGLGRRPSIPRHRRPGRSRAPRRAGPPRREQRRHQGARDPKAAWPTCLGTAIAAWAAIPVKCPMLNVGIQLDAATPKPAANSR